MALPTPVVVPEENEFFWFMGRAWDRIVNLYDLLVFSSLLLSLECVAMAYVSCFIQQVPWNALSAIIPFLVAFSIYNLNRKTDEDEDAINRQDRFAFTKRYETHLFYGSILSLAGALALSATYGIPSLLATAAPFLCGLLYSFRWLPKRSGYRRLKEIPAVKNIVVGFAWAILLSLLPVFLNHGMPDSRTAITFLLFFMWGFMASLIPDIRDRAGDASARCDNYPGDLRGGADKDSPLPGTPAPWRAISPLQPALPSTIHNPPARGRKSVFPWLRSPAGQDSDKGFCSRCHF